MEILGLDLLRYYRRSCLQGSDAPQTPQAELTVDAVMPSAGMPGTIPSWPAASMRCEVANLSDTWGPPQLWGIGPEPPNGLQVLQPVGERGALGKKRGLAVLQLLGGWRAG